MHFWARVYRGAFKRRTIFIQAPNPKKAQSISEEHYINVEWLTPALGPIPEHLDSEESEQAKNLRAFGRILIRQYFEEQKKSSTQLMNAQ